MKRNVLTFLLFFMAVIAAPATDWSSLSGTYYFNRVEGINDTDNNRKILYDSSMGANPDFPIYYITIGSNWVEYMESRIKFDIVSKKVDKNGNILLKLYSKSWRMDATLKIKPNKDMEFYLISKGKIFAIYWMYKLKSKTR